MWTNNDEVRTKALEIAKLAATTEAYAAEWNLDSADLTLDHWESIPLLGKEQLLAGDVDDPYRGRLTVDPSELAWVFAAPGPIYMPFTEADLDGVTDAYSKALHSCGLNSDDIVDQTLLYNWVIAATMVDAALRKVGCAVVPGGPGSTEQHAEVISKVGVTGIVAMPSFLEHLMGTLGDRPHRLSKAVIMGELRDSDAKERLESEHGLQVREFYGVGDVGAVAYECAQGDGMHLRPDLMIEFIDPQTGQSRTPAIGEPAEIVVTDLARRAMPIVRLRSGDLVDELRTDDCACGNSAPRIGRIIGRASEITKVKGMFVVPTLVSRTLAAHGIENDHCIVVDRVEGRDTIEVVIAGVPSGDQDAVRADLERALRLRLDISYSSALPPGEGLLRDRRTFQSV